MQPYSVDPRIFDESLDELDMILQWVTEREGRKGAQNTFLVGGWAVYAYNDTLKSIDVDLVTNSDTRNSLKHFLTSENGYKPYTDESGTTISKRTDYGEIIIDFATTSDPCNFLGRTESLSFSEISNRYREIPIRSVNARIPERTLLLLYKLKAAHDRTYKIDHSLYRDPEWGQGKLVKDYADVIALLDPARGGRNIDLYYLGDKLKEWNFLRDYLAGIPGQRESIDRYGKMDRTDVERLIDNLLSLI
jgi:hypothetical protein